MEINTPPQGKRPRRWAALASFGLVLWLLVLTLNAVAADPTAPAACVPGPHSGTITASEEWCAADSPHLVSGDVTVQNGAVLTIEPGVEVRFAAGTELRIGEGRLLAVGTAALPITFTADTLTPTRGFWDRIFFDDAALTSTLRYCLVEYAGTGVAVGGDTDFHTIDHCTLRYNGDGGDWSSGGGINSAGDVLTITHNLIYSNELGIRLRKSFGDVITGNQIYDNDGFGLGFIAANAPGGGNNLIGDNDIHHNGGFGIGFVPQGIYDGGSSNVIVRNRIHDNVAAGGYGGHGLYLDTGVNNVVTATLIYGNAGHGLWARSQPALRFTNNIVRGNGQNGLTYADINYIPAALHSNVLCNNAAFEIENLWSGSLPAEGNWFGTNSPTLGLEISGTVDFDPWISMSVAAVPSTLPADGHSTAALTLTLTGGGHAVPAGYTATLTLGVGSITPTLLTLHGGRASATYTAALQPGPVAVTATDGCATFTFSNVLTLTSALDLAVRKEDGGLLIGPNKEYALEYTIIISNKGPLTATAVVVSDTLPAGTAYGGSAWTCAGGLCSRSLGVMPPGITAALTLPLTLDKNAISCPLVLTNTVRVADVLYGGDANPADNVFTRTGTFPCLPDLVVVKNDNVGPPPLKAQRLLDRLGLPPLAPRQGDCVQPGETISYTIAYVNGGLLTATQVVLTETLPDHTGYVGSGWTPAGGGLYTRSLGTLPPGAGGVARFIVRVDSIPPDLRVENEVRIGGAEADLAPADNVSREDTPICGSATPYGAYLPLVLKQYPAAPTPTPTPTPPPTPLPAYVSDVAVNEVTNRVYVASPQQDAVFAVDPTGGGSVVATIPVGDHPLGLAVVTTTDKIYAANMNSWTLTAIRGSDHTPIADIYVGAQPCKVAADGGDARVYVTNHLESDNGAAAVNSQTDTFLHYYSRLHATQGRYGIAVDPTADILFIAARDAGLIAIQDADQPDQDPLIFKLDPPRVPYVVAFNPTTKHLFVTAAEDNVVVVLDPYNIRWNKGRWLWYENRWVFALDRANAGWIAEIGVGAGAEEGIAVNPRSGYVYVSNGESDTVSIIQDAADPANIRRVMDLAVGDRPQGVAVDASRNLIYVGNANSRDLTVIDGATHTVSETIPLD